MDQEILKVFFCVQ